MGTYIQKKFQTAPVQAVTESSLTSNSNTNVPTIKAVNDGFARKQLLINNDFQINQRGQSEYANNSGNIQYTLDMWYMTWGTINVLANKNIRIIPLGDTAYLQQYIMSDITNSKITMCVKVDGNVHKKTGNVNKTAPIILETSKFNLVFQYDTNKSKFKVNLVIKQQITLEYIDLFEGDIAYPHVKEDKDIALMRCQRKYIELDVVATIIYKYTETSALYSLTFPKMDAIPNITYIEVQANDNNGNGMNAHLGDLIGIGIKQDFAHFRIDWAKALAKEIGGHNCIIKLSCEPL